MAKLGEYKSTCLRGHLREGDNLLVTPSGQRVCRQCMKIRWDEYRKSEHGKEKTKEIADRYRENNAEHIRERNRLRTVKCRQFIQDIKKGPCSDCGNHYPPCAMDLDHVRGEKKDDLSGMCDSGYTLRALMEEVNKCELVCANCHRVRTHKRRQANG